MRVAEVAKRVGVSPDTVRYYCKIGLLRPERNADNGYQVFGAEDAGRLRFIRTARSLGFTLADIRAIFEDAERGESPCPRVRGLIESHIAEIDRQIAELSEMRREMNAAIAKWERMPDSVPDGHSVCSLIESFARA